MCFGQGGSSGCVFMDRNSDVKFQFKIEIRVGLFLIVQSLI